VQVQNQSSVFQEGYIEVEKVPDAESARNSLSGSSSGKAYINAKKNIN
jgi:hypothetical protein